MHIQALRLIIESVRIRVSQGDSPTEPPQNIETLEESLLALADMYEKQSNFNLLFSNKTLRSKINKDPDDDPSAGNS